METGPVAGTIKMDTLPNCAGQKHRKAPYSEVLTDGAALRYYLPKTGPGMSDSMIQRIYRHVIADLQAEKSALIDTMWTRPSVWRVAQ